MTMDDEQDDEGQAIQHFSRHSSHLPLDVYRIHVSNAGEILSRYTDSIDDQNYCVVYPHLHEAGFPDGVQIIR